MTAWVVLRGGGALWALPGGGAEVRRDGDAVRLRSATGGELSAEAVLAVDEKLRVRAAGPVWRRWCGDGCAGLAMWNGSPVVVLRPGEAPATLRAQRGDEQEQEEPHE